MKGWILILILLVGCSHDYNKGKPDFTKKGTAALEEYDKFRLNNFYRGHARFREDDSFHSTNTRKFIPVLKEVSPKAYEEFQSLRFQEQLSWGIFAVWISTIFIRTGNGQISPLYWAGAASYFGHMFYMQNRYEKLSNQYNEDLKSKFAPSLSWNSNF